MSRKKTSKLEETEAALHKMTFREKLNDAERLTREFAGHLEQSFMQDVKNLSKQVRKAREENDSSITDISIRDCSCKVFAQERFTQTSFQKLDIYLVAIQHEIERLTTMSDEQSS